MNLRKKVTGFALGLALMLGAGGVFAANGILKEAVGVKAETSDSIDFSKQGYTNQQAISTAKIGENVTVSFDKGSNSNAPKYFTSGAAIRVYGGNTFTVTLSDEALKLSSITLGFGNSDGTNGITSNVGSFTSPTWAGSSSAVKFTVAGTSGNRRLASISIVCVSASEHSVTISGDNSVEVGKTIQLSAVCSQGDDDMIEWSIDSTAYATISNTGLVEANAVGSAVVTAKCENGTSATHNITVIAAEPAVIKGKTVSEVTALDADDTKIYELNGYVSAWASSSATDGQKYGNFYIKDNSVTDGDGLLVYGATALAERLTWDGTKFSFSNPQDFLKNTLTKDVVLGTKITIYGFRLDFSDKKEFQGIVTAVETPAAQATAFAAEFMNATKSPCEQAEGDRESALSAIWSTLEESFNNLTSQAQELIRNQTADASGDEAAQAAARYDQIVGKYSSLNNFAGRSISTSPSAARYNGIIGSDFNALYITLVVMAVVTAIGGVMLFRRKKHQ